MTTPQDPLAVQHRAELEMLSDIAPHVIEARGYRTISDVRDLPREFADYQARAGLLIPIRSVRGKIESYQLKPFNPREREGKPIKYETAANAPQVIDVPAASLEHMGNPKVPLVITEGAKKVDSAYSNGLCCIGLQGVYGWRGTNPSGGKTALPDWEMIALNDREVLLAFDSDVMTKPSVRDALVRLSSFLKSKGAKVRYLLLPHLDDGSKCGLDDWFALGRTRESLADLIVADLPPLEGEAASIRLVTRRLSEVQQQSINWLWPNWLPKGMLTLLGGYAGDGKSTITLALAAALSTAAPLPDGTSPERPMNTLLVLSEDDISHVVKNRLDIHGADHTRIHTLDSIATPDGGVRGFNVRTDVPLLQEFVEREEIDLVVIDPLSSHLANGDRNNEGDVRDSLMPLIRMMEHTGVTVIGVMHIGKGDGQARAMQRLMGSTAFTALARSVWMVQELPADFQVEGEPTRKMLAVSKSNYAVKPAALQFCRPVDAALTFLGTSPVGIEEVFSWRPRKDTEGASPETDRTEEWLVEFMDGKPVAASTVLEECKANGYSVRTLRKVKDRLGLPSRKEGDQWVWLPVESAGGEAA